MFAHQSKMQALLRQLELPIFNQYTSGDMLYQAAGSAPIGSLAGQDPMAMYRVEGGMQSLIKGLQRRLLRDDIKLQHSLTAIRPSSHGWILDYQHQDQSLSISCPHLILAMPPRIIVRYLTGQDWAQDPYIATARDITEPSRHPSINGGQWRQSSSVKGYILPAVNLPITIRGI